jgi:uncharacterized repeat protein (TIGR01451 family)
MNGDVRRAVIALLALLASAFLLAAPASAAPLAGSAFDTGDGNQDNGLGLDWQAAVTAGAVKESPDANDDCFVGGVKELTPNLWAFNRSAGGCTPGKSNLRVAYVNPESAAATTFGHFAFFRNDTTGNSFLTFELNQLASTWTNATGTQIPCRSNGDVLLSFEVGGSTLTTSLYRWTGDGSGPAACPNGANGTFAGSGAIPASRFQGAMNAASAIANYVNPGAHGATFPANAFGEAAIDLPAVLQSMGASPCFGFLQMQVHTRSSSSISSAMIDYTTPVPVNIQSCAAIGTQYQDTNGNGTREAGEPGLAGFEAYVDLDDDGARDAGEPSGVSDATGFYRILEVPAGSYRIRQVPRAGWRCSQPSPCSYARSFTASGNSTGNDFGNLGPSTASGTAFDDTDGDGVRDAGEPGLAGATLYADLDGDGTLDAGEPSDASDAAGAFTIGDIPAGTFRIREVTPAGRTCSTPAPCHSEHTFTSGSAVTGLLFGSWAAGTIAGHVREDPATPLAGAQVFLDANANGAFDLGERQATTDATGAYSIGGLAPGAYTARVTLPSVSWYCTGACGHAVTITSGLAAGGRDFTLARFGTVSGTVWDDVDGDGVREAGDNPVAGFTQWVDYDGDNALDAGEPSATSSATGSYTLTGVRAGSWTLRQAPNGAYACTSPSPCTYALTLGSNATVTGRDFGDYVSRSVSGTVYRDSDADGVVPEAGDPGLAGWVAYVDNDKDAIHDAGEPSSTTNSTGLYNITGVPNGAYEVRIVGQAGWTCSAPTGCRHTGSIGNGQSDTGKNFGVWGPATISGTVREDADADGTGDAALAGRTVYVDSNGNAARDAGEPSATSDATGAWSIAGLNPGTYTVRQVLPAGWTCSQPSPCSYTIATASGSLSGRDFASFATGSVSGTVREDADADGAGDAPLAGRTVYADTDGDGALDAGEPQAASGGGGAYTLTGLLPGAHTIRQVLPAGWTQSAPAGGHAVAVTSGSSASGRDFASHTTGSISGTAFEDADFDGSAREAGDPALAGRTLFLDLDGDGTRGGGEPQATTDGTGAYAFTGVAPGAYTVRAVMPAGWACAYPSGCSAAATVTSGAAVSGRDFGSYLGASVSGTVFEDLDADGAAREPDEPAGAGIRVYLDGNANEARDASEPSATTDASGAYAFSGITARSWQVRVDLAAGWSCDRPAPCGRDVTLTSGSNHPGNDFGVHRTGTISGHLFTDRDADGQAQAFGENDQPERTVYLDADGDGEHDAGERSTVTDDRGDYAFAGLQPGDHRVRQVLPAGWTCSTPSPCVHTVTLTSGAAEAARDFSSWTTASFTGLYFEDGDADGEYPEPGEPGLAGRTVYLDADGDGAHDGGEPSTTTAGDGRFSFSGLEPRTYVVRSADQPADWTCSYPSPCSATLTLEAAERAQDVDFGAFTTGTVTGTVSRDDTGAGLGGWTVYGDADGDGAHDAGEPSTATLADGTYALDLEPGDHVVRQVAPSGWTCTAPAPCERAVTVASQATISGQDFENRPAASLTGTVFEDSDGDGVRDAGEPRLAGVAVALDVGTPSATTGVGGTYELSVGAGTHTVEIELPAGYACGTPAACARSATVAAGETASGLDFALWRAASVSGTVREDADADGDGDGPLAGRTVYADLDGDGSADAGEPSATSGADGGYALTGLAPGAHAIRLLPAAASTCSDPASCRRDVVLTSGQDAREVDFAAWRDGAIAGVVVDDSDGDGTRDAGEPGLEGIVVYLDDDGDGARDAGEPQATTGAAGGYSLPGLRPGERSVRVELPPGRRCTATPSCAAQKLVTSGATVTHDVAVWAPSTLTGTVFEDTDGDGVRDAGEPRLAGVAVALDVGTPSATTGVGGTYELSVGAGTHTVEIELPAGYACGTPAACARSATVAAGETASGLDFALWRAASVSGTVREDADADGDGDGPLAGRTVYADLDGDGSADAGEPSATSGADGGYALTGLAPGAHAIRLLPAAASTCSDPASCRRDVVLTSGQDAREVDFAAWRDGAIAGVVVDDSDGDGTRDAGEPGLEGIVVYLDDDGDGARDAGEPQATTGAAGGYSLPGLRPGERSVRVELPPGRRCTATPSCAAQKLVTSGATVTHDVAVWAPSTLTGTVFEDTDADGAAREPGEPAIEGAEVFVDADGDGARDAGEASATTGADGAYAIPGLAPGSHAVRVVVPAGWRCTRPDPCATTVTATSGSTPSVPAFGLADIAADLSVTLDRDPDALVAGRPAAWTATVANAGPFPADDATLTIELPAGLGGITWTPPAGVTCSRAGQTLTCGLGDLAPGASLDVELSGTVAPDRAGTTLPVAAAVDATTPDPDPSNDEADEAPPVAGVADLRTTAELPPGARVGEVVDLVLRVTNRGPSDTTGVTLVATLPEGLDPVVAGLPAGCTVAGRTLTCAGGPLAVDEGVTRTIRLTVGPAAGGRELTVPVAATSALPDPTPPDATDEADVAAEPVADVEVVVSDPPHLGAGGYEYGLTVTNRGPSPATGVVVTDGPFPGARIVSVTSSHGDCAVQADGSLRCELGDLPDGEQIRVTVVLEVGDGTDPESIGFAPTVNAAESDPAMANNATTLRLPPQTPVPAEPQPEPEPEPEPERRPEPGSEPAPEPQPAPEPSPVSPAGAPAPGGCGSRRVFPIRVRRLHGHRVVRAWMTLDGVPLKVRRRNGRFVATIDLRGRPTGVATVRIRARTASGRVLRGVRTYHTCTEVPRMSLPPL